MILGGRRTCDTSGALYERSDGTRAYECTHGDGECVDAVCDGGVFKIERDGITETGEFNHGV